MLDALEIVAQQTGSAPMRIVITDIRDSIHRGTSFSAAVDAHPDVFPAFYRAMLESAEYTGNLDDVLSQLAEYLERDIAAKRQVKSALTYPIVVLVVAFIAMIVMSVFVLPKFTGLYESLGAKSAAADADVDRLHRLHDQLLAAGLLGTGLIVGVFFAVVGGKRGKGRRDTLAMKLPVIGNLFHLISLERFCRVLSIAVDCRRAAAGGDRAVGRQHQQLALHRPRWSTCAKRSFAVAVSTSRWPRRACSRSPLGR